MISLLRRHHTARASTAASTQPPHGLRNPRALRFNMKLRWNVYPMADQAAGGERERDDLGRVFQAF